jgi:hypothetical protein
VREKLAAWASKTFGRFGADDIFNLKEEWTRDKQGGRVQTVNLFAKIHRDYRAEWTQVKTFSKWIEELRRIVGEALILRISSVEAKELKYGGMRVMTDGKADFKETLADAFAYQFNMVAVIPIKERVNAEIPSGTIQ